MDTKLSARAGAEVQANPHDGPCVNAGDCCSWMCDACEMKRAEVREAALPFHVTNLDPDAEREDHGNYATLTEARGAVRFDRLTAYEIWQGNVRRECCEYTDNITDDRARQGLGLANASERAS